VLSHFKTLMLRFLLLPQQEQRRVTDLMLKSSWRKSRHLSESSLPCRVLWTWDEAEVAPLCYKRDTEKNGKK